MTRPPAAPSLLEALIDLPRVSAPGWRRVGWLRRYLITVRAAVLPLTLFACLFGGALALPWTPAEGWRLCLATAALVLGHAASNLLNDQVAWLLGADQDGHFRLRYGTHPLAQRLMHPLTHVLLLTITAGGALLLGVALCRAGTDLCRAGTPAWWLAGVGCLLLVFHTWPLKRLGLGESAVFVVWGPIIVGGVYWVVSGDWGPEILVLSVLFGLGPTVAVLGKHADERRDDAARGIRTLPVRLGSVRGPRLIALLASAEIAGGLVWVWVTASWTYLTLLAALPSLVHLVGICLRRRPTARPKNHPAGVWPLWYAAAAFRFARAAGASLVAGAVLAGL